MSEPFTEADEELVIAGLYRATVLEQVVSPWIVQTCRPATHIHRIQAGIAFDLMQGDLADRRQVLGDFAFKQAMLEEIGARIEALARMAREGGCTP
ncbi:hypothetical protein [uncultured Methylobacterium sp.]|jgi:hypothetical protein|uniref:hypothetical protein n=1 Tax=uncultured Methylobacterium sp. TaxID=157278 RepID=UPI0026095FCE|nr:hypothetical protein [uncultured Methylobacterium sp.]